MVFIFTHGRPVGLACKAQAEEYGVKTPSFHKKKKKNLDIIILQI